MTDKAAKFHHLMEVYLKAQEQTPSESVEGIRVVMKIERDKTFYQIRWGNASCGQATPGNFGNPAADVAEGMAALLRAGWQKDHVKTAKAFLVKHPGLKPLWSHA